MPLIVLTKDINKPELAVGKKDDCKIMSDDEVEELMEMGAAKVIHPRDTEIDPATGMPGLLRYAPQDRAVRARRSQTKQGGTAATKEAKE